MPIENEFVVEQKDPGLNSLPAVWNLVIQDMKDRDQEGVRKYGVRLQPQNGRNILIDQYQELLDAVVYSRSQIEEMKLLGADLREIRSCLDSMMFINPSRISNVIALLDLVLAKNPALVE